MVVRGEISLINGNTVRYEVKVYESKFKYPEVFVKTVPTLARLIVMRCAIVYRR